MAKPSKLDLAIEKAQKEYDLSIQEAQRHVAVLDALKALRGYSQIEDDSAPKQKRTRKKKGLPEAAMETGK